MFAASITTINPAWFAPLGGLIGGIAAVMGYRRINREERAAKAEADMLLRQLLIGRRGVPGFEDTPGLDRRMREQEHRLAAVVLTTQDMSKELHPNHGTSMKDTVDATHRLAEMAAVEAGRVARVLDSREQVRKAGEALLRDRIRQHPDMRELNQLLDVLPPPEDP